MRKLKNSELNRLSIEDFKTIEKTPLIVILDNVRSLNNIGSVFRSSDAFRIAHIYLCGITATPPHKDIQKTALGSTESVSWSYAENTLSVVQDLQQKKGNRPRCGTGRKRSSIAEFCSSKKDKLRSCFWA